jgi:hypothetical protein
MVMFIFLIQIMMIIYKKYYWKVNRELVYIIVNVFLCNINLWQMYRVYIILKELKFYHENLKFVEVIGRVEFGFKLKFKVDMNHNQRINSYSLYKKIIIFTLGHQINKLDQRKFHLV